MNYIRDYALDLLNGRLKDYVENVSTEQVEISYNNFRSITIAIKNVLLKPQFLELIPIKLPLELVDGIIPELNFRSDDIFQGIFNIECDGIKLIIKANDKCNSEEGTPDFPDILRQTEQLLGDLANLGGNKDDTGLTGYISKGLRLVISCIDLVLKNTTIDIEYSPVNSKNGIGLRVDIPSLKLSSKQLTEENGKTTSLSQNIELEGVSFSTLEFKNNNLCKESSANIQFVSACSFSSKDDLEEDSKSEEDKKCSWYKRQVVPVAKFIGTQKITIYTENAEINARVPGVEMEINSIIFMVTPRQVHLLMQLFQVILNSYDRNENVHQKPMTMSDYKLVQEDLQRQISGATGIQSKTTWSSPTFVETCLPKKVEMPSLDTSFSSTFEDSTGLDTLAQEDINFKFCCDRVMAVILHEDILNVSNHQDEMLTASTVQQLNNITDTFFSNMVAFLNEPSDVTDKTPFVKSCKCDHLRLTLSSIKFESCQEKSKVTPLISNRLWIDNLELLECLNYRSGDENKVEDIKLFYFEEMVEGSPNISFTANDTNGTFTDTQAFNKKIILKICQPTLLVDISITERMFALLNPAPIFEVSKVQNVWTSEPKKSSNTEIDFRIEIDTLNLKLIFPIPDFRPPSDYERRPWWKRNVRDDYLFIELNDLSAGTKFSDKNDVKKYFVQCYSATVIYFEAKGVGCHLIAKITHEKKKNNTEQLLALHVDIHPEVPAGEAIPQNPMPDLMTQSTHAYIDVPVSRNVGPFSSKISLRTITIPPDIAAGETEKPPEPVLPGDKEEITRFIKSTKRNTNVEISVDLPIVECQILSKHIYEVIYNRINNDLLMWESGALNYQFQMNPLLDSEDEDEDSESVASNMYYSTSPLLKQSLLFQPPQKKRTSLCIDLKIKKGLLTMLTPVRDSANKVMPCQNGEFLFSLNNLQVFIVKGYEGDENLGYVVVQVLRLKMYHLDARMTPSQPPAWRSMDCDIPTYLHPTIYKLQEGINITDPRRRSGGRDMLSVAVRIYANEEVTPRSKMITVALGINRVILNYKMCKEPNSWISQLIDFFNVMDQPIVGYEPKHIMTELHLHVWNSAIDYRPLHIPNCGFLTISLFTFASQLSEVSNSTTLRFIAESATCYLGRKRNKVQFFNKSLVPVVNLEENYMPVIDVDLFEIGINTNDKSNPDHPEFDMRMYNNNVSISMCADSTIMFLDLLKYIAEDGDLTYNNCQELVESNYSSQLNDDDSNLLENSTDEAAKHKYVHEMIDEALKECAVVEESPKKPKQEAEVYMFNDDSTLISNLESTFPQVKQDLGTVYNRYSQESDTDEEYFIVEDCDLVNFPRNNTAEMEWIDDEECQINEEHFGTPKGPTDFLKAPKCFPVPVKKFTLCNMNIKFQIFGGSDFEPIEVRPKKKLFAITDCATYTKATDGKVQIKEREIKRSTHGGYNRCRDTLVELCLKKIQYQYDIYPEHTRQASRHAFVVNEVEVLDRLKKSQINKLLYSHITDKRPARSQTPMVLLRSIYVRPKNNKDLEECHINLGVTPIRANIDQDTLMFLMEFADTVKGSPVDSSNDSPRHAITAASFPVLNVNLDEMDKQHEEAKKKLHDGLLILLEEHEKYEQEIEVKEKTSTDSKSSLTTFFKNVTISEISIKVDYHGKVDVTELLSKLKQKDFLINLVCGIAQLKSVEFTLKRINHQRGLLGVEKLYGHCCKTWGKDILENHLSNILRGFSYISALYYFLLGLHDLFVLPVRQYKKDGRIMWGMQQGANSFTVSTASAFIELALKFLAAIKVTAEHAYIMVSPHPSAATKVCLRGKRKKCYKRPLDIREGMANALTVVKEGFGETATNIVQVATYEHERKGYSGAVGGVLRQIPALVVDPVLIATEATVNVLTGAQCHVDRDMQAESKHKWKSEDQ